MPGKTVIRAPHDKDRPYVATSRAAAQDRNLSFEARGMLWYLLSKPDDWEVTVEDLQQQCGRDKVYKILKELKEAGYIQRKRENIKDAHGHFLWGPYRVIECPEPVVQTENTDEAPFTETPYMDLPDTVKPDINTHNRETTNKDLQDVPPATVVNPPLKVVEGGKPVAEKKARKKPYDDVDAKLISGMIAAFIQIQPTMPNGEPYKPAGNPYKNDTNRARAADLIREGFTAEDMPKYAAWKRGRESWWRGKSFSWQHLLEQMPVYRAAIAPKPKPAQQENDFSAWRLKQMEQEQEALRNAS